MVRDYAGFSSVERFELNPAEMQRGYLEGEKDETGSIYLHVCSKNPAYSSSADEAFPHDHQQLNAEDFCRICGVSFVDFRKGEERSGRDEAFWHRQWEGHCSHCKRVRIP
jgi:hypothetical protein